MSEGFKIFRADQLRKVNAQRRALSQPDIYCIPTPSKADVLFVSASAMRNEPASCYNCHFYNHNKSCGLIGPRTPIRKFSYPPAPTADAKVIEYWPCCGMHDYGHPNYGPESFSAANSPESLGLGWINAPRPGMEHGGANCGGCDGGDDCDHWMTVENEKRDADTGFCRVLQQDTDNGDVCAQWKDDDWMTADRASTILRELDK